jgi:hypothetical protein
MIRRFALEENWRVTAERRVEASLEGVANIRRIGIEVDSLTIDTRWWASYGEGRGRGYLYVLAAIATPRNVSQA